MCGELIKWAVDEGWWSFVGFGLGDWLLAGRLLGGWNVSGRLVAVCALMNGPVGQWLWFGSMLSNFF